MSAQLYRLEDMKYRRSSRTPTAMFSPMLSASGGSDLILAAMSFWATYAGAMVLFHRRLFLVPFLRN